MNNGKFPINPFIDVDPRAFHSRNKKHVTEDFVSENFRNIGWDISRPFNDTGIDLIISKFVCKKNYSHTKFNEQNDNTKCKICGSNTTKIYRFIQVKTREVKGKIFGYTLVQKILEQIQDIFFYFILIIHKISYQFLSWIILLFLRNIILIGLKL